MRFFLKLAIHQKPNNNSKLNKGSYFYLVLLMIASGDFVWARDCWKLLSDNDVWNENFCNNENLCSLTVLFAFRHFYQEKGFESKANGRCDKMDDRNSLCHSTPSRWSRATERPTNGNALDTKIAKRFTKVILPRLLFWQKTDPSVCKILDYCFY